MFSDIKRPQDALSPQARESARKIEAVILRRLRSVGQVNVAEALGVSEATVSRMKGDGELARIANVLAALGVEVMEPGDRVVNASKLAALIALAEDGFSALKDSLR